MDLTPVSCRKANSDSTLSIVEFPEDGYISKTPTRTALFPREFNFSGSHKSRIRNSTTRTRLLCLFLMSWRHDAVEMTSSFLVASTCKNSKQNSIQELEASTLWKN